MSCLTVSLDRHLDIDPSQASLDRRASPGLHLHRPVLCLKHPARSTSAAFPSSPLPQRLSTYCLLRARGLWSVKLVELGSHGTHYLLTTCHIVFGFDLKAGNRRPTTLKP